MINWPGQCAAVIPCFNEAGCIGEVVSQVRSFLPRVIVVDDGSTDSTAVIARHAGADVIRFAKNHGKGAALQAGWRRAHAEGFSWVLLLDGDGQHAAGDIPEFFTRAEAGGYDLVVGNRMNDCASMPWLRRHANQWMSRRLSHLTGVALPDSQCGFRLVNLEKLHGLALRVNRFEIESAMLAAFCQARLKISFVPAQTIYRRGRSKINPVTDTFRWLRWRLAQKRKLVGAPLNQLDLPVLPNGTVRP